MEKFRICCDQAVHVKNLIKVLESTGFCGPKFNIVCEDEVFLASDLLGIYSPLLSSLYNSNIGIQTVLLPQIPGRIIKLLLTLLKEGSVYLPSKDLPYLDSMIRVAQSLQIEMKNVETFILEYQIDSNLRTVPVLIKHGNIVGPMANKDITLENRRTESSLLSATDGNCSVVGSGWETMVDSFLKQTEDHKLRVAKFANFSSQIENAMNNNSTEDTRECPIDDDSREHYCPVGMTPYTQAVGHWRWKAKCKVRVEGLPKVGADVAALKHDLEDKFGKIGSVKNVSVSNGTHAAGYSGFAFVEMENPSEAKKAASLLNGTKICGFKVSVKMGGTGKAGTLAHGRNVFCGSGVKEGNKKLKLFDVYSRHDRNGRRHRSNYRSTLNEAETKKICNQEEERNEDKRRLSIKRLEVGETGRHQDDCNTNIGNVASKSKPHYINPFTW